MNQPIPINQQIAARAESAAERSEAEAPSSARSPARGELLPVRMNYAEAVAGDLQIRHRELARKIDAGRASLDRQADEIGAFDRQYAERRAEMTARYDREKLWLEQMDRHGCRG